MAYSHVSTCSKNKTWEIGTGFLKNCKLVGQSMRDSRLLHKAFVLTDRIVDIDIYASTVLISNPCSEPVTTVDQETGTWYIHIIDDYTASDIHETVWNLSLPTFRPSRIVVNIVEL